jgi:hypothetical protein
MNTNKVNYCQDESSSAGAIQVVRSSNLVMAGATDEGKSTLNSGSKDCFAFLGDGRFATYVVSAIALVIYV